MKIFLQLGSFCTSIPDTNACQSSSSRVCLLFNVHVHRESGESIPVVPEVPCRREFVGQRRIRKKKRNDEGSNPRPLDPVYSALDRSATLDPLSGKSKGKSLPFSGVHRVTRTYAQIPWSKLCTWNVSSLFPSSMHFTCVLMLVIYTPTLANFVNYPLCFLTAFSSGVTSQLFSRKRGGASDSKTQTDNTGNHYFNYP